jgi:hypothetical protein
MADWERAELEVVRDAEALVRAQESGNPERIQAMLEMGREGLRVRDSVRSALVAFKQDMYGGTRAESELLSRVSGSGEGVGAVHSGMDSDPGGAQTTTAETNISGADN